jgi:hypothetical protein
MTKFRLLIWLIALLVMKTLQGQGGLPLIQMKDAISGQGISQVHVLQGELLLAISDENGLVQLEVQRPCTLSFTHVSYEREYRVLRRTDQDTITIHLRQKVVMLDPVDVLQPGPEVIYQRADLHVGGHQVNQHGLWVLAYEKPNPWHRQDEAGRLDLRGVRLQLLDSSFKQVAELDIPFAVRGFHKDHLQRIIVEGDEVAWMVEGTMRVTPIDRQVLHEAVLQWKDTVGGLLLGDDRDATFPAFAHVAYDPATEEMKRYCEVEDPFVMQLFRSQYKYMSGRDKVIAMDLEVSTGVDREIIAGYMTGFHHDPYFKVPYAPMFVVNDTICVFDHGRALIRRFDKKLRSVDEVPIEHHKQRGWKKELLQDPVTRKIYSLYGRSDRMVLIEIDPATGMINNERMLTHPWPESVKVYGGSAWYIYREYGSTQRRTLYREPLN